MQSQIRKAMRLLADDPRTVFVGQSCQYSGASIYESLKFVPMSKRVEMPVIEDFQMGYCTGLALTGKVPICIYPRMDFLLLALNQLVNHLDRIPLMSAFRPKVIVRTQVRSGKPLNPGHQHLGNYTESILDMLKTVGVMALRAETDIVGSYRKALETDRSWLMVEYVS